jgi:TRAP-type C4-dicarboxylate transport system permease small subunit
MDRAIAFSGRVNWLVERICALLVAAMVAIVWFGVVSRYLLEWGVTWTEELSRYVMIWAALLAVSCGAYRREHIGLEFLPQKLAPRARRGLKLVLDLIGFAFFLYLAIFGLGMVRDGAGQFATIFGMTMQLPFAAVPAAAGLTAYQIAVSILRDLRGDAGLDAQVLEHGGAA